MNENLTFGLGSDPPPSKNQMRRNQINSPFLKHSDIPKVDLPEFQIKRMLEGEWIPACDGCAAYYKMFKESEAKLEKLKKEHEELVEAFCESGKTKKLIFEGNMELSARNKKLRKLLNKIGSKLYNHCQVCGHEYEWIPTFLLSKDTYGRKVSIIDSRTATICINCLMEAITKVKESYEAGNRK